MTSSSPPDSETAPSDAASPRRPLWKRLLFALIPMLVLALLVEGTFRLAGVGRFETRLPSTVGAKFEQTSPDGRKATYETQFVMSVPATVNEMGYRGWLRHEQKPEGTLRVAAVGDSFTFGSGVGDDETWPAYVETQLREALGPEQPVEVLNFGLRGRNTAQEFEKFESVVLPFDPDVVVLNMTLFNDAETHAEYKAHAAKRKTARPSPKFQLVKWLKSNSNVMNFAAEWWRRGFKRQAMIDHLERQFAVDAPGWIECRAALLGFARVCREKQLPLIVVLFPPIQDDVGLNTWSDYPSFAVHARIRAVFEDHPEVEILDLVPELVPLEGQRVWLEGDTHPTPRFYEHVATPIAERTLEKLGR